MLRSQELFEELVLAARLEAGGLCRGSAGEAPFPLDSPGAAPSPAPPGHR